MQIVKLLRQINRVLRRANLYLDVLPHFKDLERNKPLADEFKFLLTYPNSISAKYMQYRNDSAAQRRQDLFVQNELNYKTNGYFVEFGACDGLFLSNSYMLEKVFHWNGIVAEPGTYWHNDLKKNRTVAFETDCVWSVTGDTLTFNEVESPTLSTIDNFSQSDHHKDLRNTGKRYNVQTISLTDLLKKHQAPHVVDYLSIDTEGSEFDILNAHDFDAYKFKIITVEHNFSPMRLKIFELLTSKGYNRVHEAFSSFDDWYILNNEKE